MNNVVWLFIDGVRRYYSEDDRSRLKFMDEFAKDAVEFKNVVTSAPSTFMSLSAMVSGMPSYFINRNFDDFRFDKDRISSLTSDLKRNGINNYSFIMHPATRESMNNVFPMIPKKYWPKGLVHRKWWSNDDIKAAVDKTLTMGVDTPAFFFVDYNCRNDFNISDKVKKTYQQFIDSGFNEDNTIFILCSDHGYPDASKETGKPEYYTENNLTHDLILTDDNIMIPFFIKYPGCKKNLKIDTTISSIDLYPTIIDLLGIPPNPNILGVSLRNLMEEMDNNEIDNRFHRTDSRLAMQVGRGTSIRNSRYKYILYHDKVRGGEAEEFFDIVNDPLESKNLINDNRMASELSLFKSEYRKSENAFMENQIQYLFDVFKKNHPDINKYKSIVVVDSSNSIFTIMLCNVLKRINSSFDVQIVLMEKNTKEFEGKIDSGKLKYIGWGNLSGNETERFFSQTKADLVITPLSSNKANSKILIKQINKLQKCKKMFVDYNLDGYKQPLFASHVKQFKSAWPFLKQEPLALVSYFYKYAKAAARKGKKVIWKS